MTYLITFACYGCHLHGDGSGSVDPTHNVPGTPVLEEDSARAAREEQRMDQPAYRMDQIRRDAVLEAIQEVCGHRGWTLLAAHVRSNHVHTVVEAEAEPDRVMKDFKAYASRRLNRKIAKGVTLRPGSACMIQSLDQVALFYPACGLTNRPYT